MLEGAAVFRIALGFLRPRLALDWRCISIRPNCSVSHPLWRKSFARMARTSSTIGFLCALFPLLLKSMPHYSLANMGGVRITGVISPKRRLIAWICWILLVLAKCLQFHVRR